MLKLCSIFGFAVGFHKVQAIRTDVEVSLNYRPSPTPNPQLTAFLARQEQEKPEQGTEDATFAIQLWLSRCQQENLEGQTGELLASDKDQVPVFEAQKSVSIKQREKAADDQKQKQSNSNAWRPSSTSARQSSLRVIHASTYPGAEKPPRRTPQASQTKRKPPQRRPWR